MLNENDIKDSAIIEIAKKMAIAARTAPKGRGQNTIEIKIATGKDLELLANKMIDTGIAIKQHFFERDAENLKNSSAALLLGTRISALGLSYCGLCGAKNCETKNKSIDLPCAFNNLDLGIAIGSAVSVAADNRVDNRIMYTVGMAARDLKIFDDDVKIIMGISLSASSKNIFFDRK